MGETRSKDDGIADIRRLQRDLDAERTNRQEAQQQLEQVKAELSMILRKNKELQLQLVNCKQDLEKEKQNTQTAVEVKDKTTKHSSQMKGTLDDKSAEIKHLKDKIKSMETENSSTLSQLDLLLENLVQEFSNSMSEEKKKSIFLTASTCGLPGTVGHLAGIGVDINVQTKPSQPASLYDTGFFDESDAAISLHDDSNIPVLFYCAQKGDYKCVEKLIEKGADVRYKDSLGDTALMYASRGVCVPVAYSPKAKTKVEDRLITEDHVRCMEVLIQHGADVNARNFIGCSPLTYCTMYGSKSGVEKLLDKGARVDDKNNEGKAALHFAAVSYTDKQHDCVSAILRHGADVNITDSEGNTALILSVMNKNLQCIQKLLEYKPDLDVQNKIGVSALGLSAEHNKDDIVSLLLKAGAKHNIKFNKGETALIIAAKHNSVKVLKLLLGSGAVVNEVDDEGNTALIAAADNFNDESISCLLEAGANVNHRNKSGHTALSLLQSSSDTSSRKKCIKAFSNAGT
ncbi:serine/threonine-protein phosphatase 6 regulatory ankyrin repeat subunit B-like [Physella acuta]|uniref:serine/threonine-protein phosphatase 6 regulatory ankyrin repeat subunit B-like n=1 Tax=Physella acuta TaxID=109671 RepID=UPI0027DD6B2D|nr:serine/threonine-protein phosphatase 6 regulatory ankyrin repeat subunit B-like [Physella acuta]